MSLASNICCLIFIGCLTVQFDLSDYKQLPNRTVLIRAVKNQSDLRILLLTQLLL